MYCEYYGFRGKPFNITPDPGFIFLSDQHREAFAHLLYGIDSHIGFITLTGEIGTGKTTVIRTLLSQLSADTYRTALIFNPCLSSLGLMRHINKEFGLSAAGADTAELLTELNQFLLDEHAAQRTVVLVVDEAQNLEPGVLEQIRLISNLETERDKLIQIVLVGQPELRELLQRPELRQLGQRVGVSYHLDPMNLTDTHAYIAHRTGIAGRKDSALFSDGAIDKIYAFSRGFPRLINLVCDRALLLGFTTEKTPISPAMATKAIADIRPVRKKRRRLSLAAVIALAAIVLAVTVFLLFPSQKDEPIAANPPGFSAFVSALATMSEQASAVAALNEVASFWGVKRLEGTQPTTDPEQFGRGRGLDTYSYTGSLATALRFGIPMVLEVALPDNQDRRYFSVSAGNGGTVLITPPLAGVTSATGAEVEQLWKGQAYLFWNNYLEIPPHLKPGGKGEPIKRLQGLLRASGTYRGALTGIMDRTTMTAIRQFQQAHGIEETGIAGKQTLLLLYGPGGGKKAREALADREKTL